MICLILRSFKIFNIAVISNFNHCSKNFQYGKFEQRRFIGLSCPLGTKKIRNPNEEVIVNKKTKKSASVKTLVQKKLKQKQSVWGVVDVYRFITLEKLASLMSKTDEQLQEAMLYCPQITNIQPSAVIEDMMIVKDIAAKFGYKIRIVPHPNSEKQIEMDKDVHPRPPAPLHELRPRPAVVTVMGHVDHGKTTLLDSMRGASVAKNEAGGITQHIGAFIIEMENKEKLTFLDTPGHAAFRAMRARGAHCTDIIVLVIAAEDGVMPQTKEVLELAREGNVPLVVAINKIDAPGANVNATKNGLLKIGLNFEEYGGDVMCVCISALYGTNLDQLSDAIITQATLMDLKSDYSGLVECVVIEARTDSNRGKLATVIVTRGTLRKGCILVAGLAHARVRGIFNHNNQPIEQATPSTPAEILGWRELPRAGDLVLEVDSERRANSVIKYREQKEMLKKADEDAIEIDKKRVAQNAIYQQQRKLTKSQKLKIKAKTYEPDDPRPKLHIIVKTDVHGSLEAILNVLDTYDCSNKCRLSLVHYGVGPVSSSDIDLAITFNAIIYCFSIGSAKTKMNNVIIKNFEIIYRLIEDLKEEINKRIPEVEVEDILGEAEILQKFHINAKNNKVPILGCRCTNGILNRKMKFKILREGECIYDGEVVSMRHLKEEVSSIKKGIECGLQLADKAFEPEIGDVVICYTIKNVKDEVDWNPGF